MRSFRDGSLKSLEPFINGGREYLAGSGPWWEDMAVKFDHGRGGKVEL